MEAVETNWVRVAEEIETRCGQQAMSLNAFYEAASISQKTMINMRAGIPLQRAAKRTGVERALGWAPGSIEAILDGGEPTEAEPVLSGDAVAVELARLGDLVERLARLIEERLPTDR